MYYTICLDHTWKGPPLIARPAFWNLSEQDIKKNVKGVIKELKLIGENDLSNYKILRHNKTLDPALYNYLDQIDCKWDLVTTLEEIDQEGIDILSNQKTLED